jgi:hypothetical protein
MFLVSNTKMVIEGMKSCGGLHTSLKLSHIRGICASIIELKAAKVPGGSFVII